MDKKGKSLLGMFVPKMWHKMRPYVKRWKHHVHGDSWGKEPEQLACLEFDFSHTYKADIYRDLARAIINKWPVTWLCIQIWQIIQMLRYGREPFIVS